MCGITGFLRIANPSGPDSFPSILKDMTAAMSHRGPDGDGFFIRDPVYLGMRRLKIIDLETGDQPIFNEDKTVAVVFNGEIYNYLELREELIKQGHRFSTHSDTEVLVHLYEQHGLDFASRLRGMFAFCLWDQKNQRLVLGRDPFGIKPLYWTRNNGLFCFASEIKALQRHPQLRWTLNSKALDDFLTLLFIPTPETAYEGVFKLDPGCFLIVNFDGSLHRHRYWDPAERLRQKGPLKLGLAEMRERLDAKLDECVRLALRSDVPLGLFLSSGLDSTMMTYYASKHLDSIRTFTIYYEDKSYSEREGAAEVSRLFHTQHTEIPLRFPHDRIGFIRKVLNQFDQPFGDLSSLPTYLLCESARKQVTVALSGDGGDELLGGYPTALATRAFAVFRHAPTFFRNNLFPRLANLLPTSFDRVSFDYKVKRFFLGGIGVEDPLAANFAWRGAFYWSERKEMYTDDFYNCVGSRTPYESAVAVMGNVSGLPFMEKVMMGDLLGYLPDLYLIKNDMTSMAHSLELRPAFLDPELAELSFLIPFSYKIRGLQTKWIVRDLMNKRLPPSILKLPKRGFTPPLAAWLSGGEFQDFIRDITVSPSFRRVGVLRSEKVEQLLKEHRERKVDHTRRLWAILALAVFAEKMGS